jgi:hypothetical protein
MDNKQAYQFAGKTIFTWKPGKSLPDPASFAIKLAVNAYNGDPEFTPYFLEFLKQDGLDHIEALVLGNWGKSYEVSAREAVALLAEHHSALPKVSAIFVGDIAQEECEVSWIKQADISPLYTAYPLLHTLQTFGGIGLSLGKMVLPRLHTLSVESGGLGKEILAQITEAQIPALTHLELWLGSFEYGCGIQSEHLADFLTKLSRFQKLTYLGLCNYEDSDTLAKMIAKKGLPPSVRRLDLSKGNLSDKGAQYLLDASDQLKQLEFLDLHHHYLSNKMMKKLSELPFKIDLRDQEEAEEDDDEVYRYISLSE